MKKRHDLGTCFHPVKNLSLGKLHKLPLYLFIFIWSFVVKS